MAAASVGLQSKGPVGRWRAGNDDALRRFSVQAGLEMVRISKSLVLEHIKEKREEMVASVHIS